MRAFGRTFSGLIATIALGLCGQQASAQQYYGYAGAQAPPAASPQTNTACYPPGSCHPDRGYGCHVTVCPCPCQQAGACIPGIPDIHVPSCQNPCIVYDEGPPTTTPVTVDIWRNCYVPVKIVKKEGPSTITPVNINVRWREVHFLCDASGAPIPPARATELLKELQSLYANAKDSKAGAVSPATETGAAAPNQAPSVPAAVPGSAPTAAQNNAPASVPPATAPPASAPPANATQVQANLPNKQWVWLDYEGVYGYGYQRSDGLWVIDEGSRRSTLSN